MGIVAMNRPQAELIEDLLAEERRTNPELDVLMGAETPQRSRHPCQVGDDTRHQHAVLGAWRNQS